MEEFLSGFLFFYVREDKREDLLFSVPNSGESCYYSKSTLQESASRKVHFPQTVSS